jgi:nucleoside-diphosphate-sugar epimerase
MRIFATGAAGYIGTTVVPFLLKSGHEVTVLDRFFFGSKLLDGFDSLGKLSVIRDDLRWFDGRVLSGHDAVVDMAALSNDPAGELDPWKTIEINYLGRSRVARLAREAGVARYLLISSCSIYGFQDGLINEESKTNPLTTYARANQLAENDNLALASGEFTSTVIRFATIYGLSRRMRFDLAINAMVLNGLKKGKIPVMRDGNQWRPFLYVGDAARAILTILQSDKEKINGQIFNIGSDDQNYRIKELAELVSSTLSNKPSLDWYGDPDNRSYRVSFKKARDVLGYVPRTTPKEAAKELETALSKNELIDSPESYTVNWYKHLISDPKARESVELRGTVL